MKKETLTKKDVKTAVGEVLAPFARAVQSDFKRVHGRLDRMEGRQEKMGGRLDKIDIRLDHLEVDLVEIRNEVREMRRNSSELFTKLDKFISLYEKQEQETKFLSAQVNRLEVRMVRLESQAGIT